jgi:hypothetical protein
MTTVKRSQGKGIRERFLYTNLTEDEHKKISQYCRENHISISQFFADLLLQEAGKSKEKPQKLTLEIELTPAEHEKLEQLTRLHKKESVSDLVREIASFVNPGSFTAGVFWVSSRWRGEQGSPGNCSETFPTLSCAW